VRDTIGSPKKWGYRTKITPHFDAPPKRLREKETAAKAKGNEEEMGNQSGDGQEGERKKWECRIGFERKGGSGVMDIEVGRAISKHSSSRS